jgi:hypothetical protein
LKKGIESISLKRIGQIAQFSPLQKTDVKYAGAKKSIGFRFYVRETFQNGLSAINES